MGICDKFKLVAVCAGLLILIITKGLLAQPSYGAPATSSGYAPSPVQQQGYGQSSSFQLPQSQSSAYGPRPAISSQGGYGGGSPLQSLLSGSSYGQQPPAPISQGGYGASAFSGFGQPPSIFPQAPSNYGARSAYWDAEPPSSCVGGSTGVGIPSFDIAAGGNYGGGSPPPPLAAYNGAGGAAGGFVGSAVPNSPVAGSPLAYASSNYGPVLPNIDFGCCFTRYTDTVAQNLMKEDRIGNTSAPVEFEVCLHACLAAAPTFNAGDCASVQFTPKTRQCELYKKTGREPPPGKFLMKYGIDYLEPTNRPGCKLDQPAMAFMTTLAPPKEPSEK